MTFFLTAAEALRVIEAAIGARPQARDAGLLLSALARPAAVLFGREAYPDPFVKAAALTHSLVANRALVDGNKRAGLACAIVFLHANGAPLGISQEAAYSLTMDVASGLADLEVIAARLRSVGRFAAAGACG
ncbi:MAG: Fic family protein [Bifidobacteriaceae bacterium]|jgi:death-on-curing protein|nr:Fic family protein [Bifidobacteriaceae bacterium]